jgi:hypothetical protein
MFRAILYTQWKWTRLATLVATVLAFAVPVLSVRDGSAFEPRLLVERLQAWSVAYAFLAAGAALAVALGAWGSDARGRHVYALVLPVARWRYALMRYAAGLALLAPVVVALLAGALVATRTIDMPAGLQGYPLALAARFLLALLVTYSLFFAVTAGSARTAGLVLAALVTLAVVHSITSSVGVRLDLVTPLGHALFGEHGLLGVLGGRWMLIDA